MSWAVQVKIETQGNGDEKTMSETILDTYDEALSLAQLFEIQGRRYLSMNWGDEVGPPKWEVNYNGHEFRIVIAEV
jgi:hypothetical protein